jgi:phosphoribosyl 1,2-cyclic phosphate phosphodiesterase
MRVTFLGTGTSHGVPVAGCGCKTCMSSDPRNKRNRTSVFIEDKIASVIIDTPAEFRLASIAHKITYIDAVLLTHAHADHVSGFDDIRRYNELSGRDMPVYSDESTLGEIKRRFDYIFADTQEGGGKPKVSLKPVEPDRFFDIKGTEVLPLSVKHGDLDILAFRIRNFAYLTDVSKIPEKTFPALSGLDVLVLNALRPEEHPTHFNLKQAVEAAQRIGAKKTYFTHLSHRLEQVETEKILPPGMFLSYDGLKIEL